MANRIQIRRDLSANWTNFNPTLAQGEPGYELDTGKIKYGDGVSLWSELEYAGGTGSGTGTTTTFVIENYTDAVSTDTGALQVWGGAGIGGDVYVGGTVYGTITTATSAVTANFANSTTNSINANNAINSNYANTASLALHSNTATLALTANTASYATTASYLGTEIVHISNTTDSASTLTGALTVAGGVGIQGNLYVGGQGVFYNTATFIGPVVYLSSTNTAYTSNLIALHTPPGGVTSTWTINDGKDIGIEIRYFTNTDITAGLVLRNSTGYLEWISKNYNTGTAVYGTFKTGALAFSDGTMQHTSAPTTVNSLTNDAGYLTSSTVNQYVIPRNATTSSLVAGSYTVSLGVDGYLNLPNGLDAAGALIQSPSPIRINSNNHFWTFGSNGSLTFPDSTVQATAYTGTVAWANITNSPTNISYFNNDAGYILGGGGISQFSNDAGYLTSSTVNQYVTGGSGGGSATTSTLIHGSYTATLDTSGNFIVPGSVFANGVTVTGGITIPNVGQAGSILSQNGLGNIYFETDNSLNFIITGTWQHVFNADGTVVFGGGYIFPNTQGTSGQVLVYDPDGNGDYTLRWRDQTGGSGSGGTVNQLTSGTAVVSLDTNGTLKTISPNLEIKIGASAAPYWVAEYGGLSAAATPLGDYVYGTGAVYDSKGNLYVIGTAEGTNSTYDSLMLKYDPEGNLLWHKTWHDPVNGGNCGATNVAIAINNNDRIYWVANDWTAGGMWCGYMDTDGNLGLAGTAQEVIGINYLNPTDIACDNSGNFYLSGYNNAGSGFGGYGIPTVVKVNGITGLLDWSSNVTPIASDSSTSTGIYRAITVDPATKSVWAIGDYVDGGNHWAMLSKWNSSGVNQWTNKLVTESGDFGEAVVFNNGYVYTVVNDGTENLTRVSKIDPDGTLVWSSALAQGTGSKGYDLSFDVSGDVYLTGIYNSLGLWVTKLDQTTGALIYSRTVATAGGELILDGQGDPIVGHRAGDIYRDRIAVVAATQDSLTQAGTGNDRVILAQLPIDGSIAGTFSNVTLADVTSSISGISSTGTYTITTLSWTTGTYGTGIGIRSQLGASVVTTVGQMSSQVINISSSTTSANWNFGNDGEFMFPDGTIQNTAWNTGTTVYPNQIAGGIGASVGSFGTDLGIGSTYAQNNPAILFSDDDMIIRTGGTAGHGTIGAMYIASSEDLFIGKASVSLTDATSLAGGSAYSTYINFSYNSTTIDITAGSNTLSVDSTTGLLYNGSTIGGNAYQLTSGTALLSLTSTGTVILPPEGNITVPEIGPYSIIDGNAPTGGLPAVLYIASTLPLDTMISVGSRVYDGSNPANYATILAPGVTSNNDGTYNIYYDSFSINPSSLSFGTNPVWNFGINGALTFPDGTKQYSANSLQPTGKDILLEYHSTSTAYWINSFGDLYYNQVDSFGNSVAYDNEGNVIVAAAEFLTLDSSGAPTASVIKYGPSGNVLWQYTFAPTGAEPIGSCDSIAIDSSNNIYLLIASYSGSDGAFVVKLDPNGTLLHSVSLINDSYSFFDLAIDTAGNAYVVGLYGSGTTNLIVLQIVFGTGIGWQKIFNLTSGPDAGYSIAVDGSSNVYVTGYGSSGSSIIPNIIKLNNLGVVQWVKSLGLTSNLSPQAGTGISVDPSGNIYIAVDEQSNGGTVLVKYDTNGNLQWQEGLDIGTGGVFSPENIQIGNDGYIYVSGYTGDVPSQQALWISKLDTNGNLRWLNMFADYNFASGGQVGGSAPGVWFNGHRDLAVGNGVFAVTGWTTNTPTTGTIQTTIPWQAITFQFPTDGSYAASTTTDLTTATYDSYVYYKWSSLTTSTTTLSDDTVTGYTVTTGILTTGTDTVSLVYSDIGNYTTAARSTGIWKFDSRGNIQLPPGGKVLDGNGNSIVPDNLAAFTGPTITLTASTSSVHVPAGTFAVADGVVWDPVSKASGKPYPVFWDGSTWNALY